MSALVWSVESAILGAWALVFSMYSTPFHAFIARSHCIIAAFNLILQLIATARDLSISHAVSESFVCAVTALLLVYITSLLDTANHKRFFSMPSAGILPMDAVIGSAWFCAAMTSATGMALSGVRHNQQRAALMFHQYGYHASIVLPSFLMLWLYNYNADNSSEPVHKGIKLIQNNITITHTLIFTVYACIWGWFVATQFLGEGFLTNGKQWSPWQDMSCGTSTAYITAAILKFLGRGGCVLIPLSATFSSQTAAQNIMAWILVGVAAAYALDLLGSIERLFGANAKRNDETQDTAPTAPIMESEFITPKECDYRQDNINQLNRTDPAALVLNATSSHHPILLSPPIFPSRPQQWIRDKMV